MAKPKKIKPIGKPNPQNTRRQSNPQTQDDKLQAIADDIEAAIYSYQPVLLMESMVRQNDMKIVLGSGSPNLKLFIDQLESDYKDVKPGGSTLTPEEQQAQPQLKKISREATLDLDKKGSSPRSKKPNVTKQ